MSGAAALNKDVANGFYELGIETVQGYGLTETSPVISVNRFEEHSRRFGTIGTVIKDVDVKLGNDG
ncbi:MAG: AMP-binding protein, partial [Gammaproteobacteria bacterium]|nr:AMP-binding protein [Gammaproteobacteria bacterium]